MHVERALRVLIVRGDEQDHGHVAAVELTEHPEAIKSRHLDVETDQIRLQLANERHRLVPALGLSDDLDIRFRLYKSANALPRQTFIVNDQNSHRHRLRLLPTCHRPIAARREVQRA